MTATASDRLIAPFRGLAPFDESELDALLFFGRETETEIAVANLLAARLTILYGPSGVGKSSLLRAGVARRIRELAGKRAIGRGPDGAVVVVSAWADDPVATIAAAVADEVTSLVKRSVAPPPGGSLADVVDYWATVLDGDLYLVLDQLEEHFVYHGEDQRPGTLVGELPEVVLRPRLRANVLLSLRDDALAQLDVFKGSIPNLFANYLRLDRLDRAAATAAILGPVQRWNDIVPAHQRVDIDPELVEAVLAQSAVAGEPDRIEPPYLQLVMERVWNAEHDAGSNVLRASTLRELGGAGAIVREHLDRALAVLDGPEQDAAARMFEHLVTPSGTKVAHRATDLAEFARVPVASVTPVLATLGRARILRSLDEGAGAGDRFEIFHDVLADAILGWRRRRDLERERATARRRQRRLAAIAVAALVLAAVMVGVTLYALSARSDARHQAARANHEKQLADQSATRIRGLLADARKATRTQEELRKRAEALKKLAERTAKRAQLLEVRAEQAAAFAEREKGLADQRLADKTAALAAATKAKQDAVRARDDANRAAATASRAAADAKRAEAKAQSALVVAQQQRQLAVARQQEFDALTLLTTTPTRSLVLGLEAAKTDRSSLDERVLRDGLLASHQFGSIALGEPARAMSASSDGTRAAIATTGRAVAVVDLVRERRLAAWQADAPLRSIAMSSDGRTVATGDKAGNVTLRSAGGTKLHSLSTQGAVNALALSPDGRILAASGQNQRVLLVDTSTGAVLHDLAAGVAVQSVVFSPKGDKLLAIGRTPTVRVFDVASGAQLYSLTQAGGARAGAFSPDGSTIVTAGAGANIFEWSAADGSQLRRLTVSGSGTVTSVQFAPDGASFATASTDSAARIWNTVTGEPQEFLIAHSAPVVGASFSEDGALVITASNDGTARIWGAGDGFVREALIGHTGGVVAARFLPGAHGAVTASSDGTVRFWDARFEPSMRAVGVHAGHATGVAFLNRTTAASSGSDGVVRIWSIPRRRPIGTIDAGVPLTGLAATADGSMIAASANDGRVFVWRADGSHVTTFAVPPPARSVAFSMDRRRLVVAAGDKTAHVITVATGHQAALAHPAAVNDAAFSPDGSLIATASSDGLGRLWRADGTLLGTLEGHDASLLSVTFSHDGKLLLTSSLDHDLRIWDVKRRTTLRVLRGHVALVSGGAFSADDKWVASAGPAKVGVWAVHGDDFRDDRLFYLSGSTGPLNAVAFSPTGNEIVSAGQDGAVRKYDCALCGGLDELVKLARQRVAESGS